MSVEVRPLPFGNYFLLERLAVGGMAEVYLAKCFGIAGFERLVALKRILPTVAEDDEFIAMFIDEAKIAGQLSHPNIAQIFDLGKLNQSYFIAMEYISGHDLRALWDRAREQGGLPVGLACYVTLKICEGLDYAHRRRDNRGRPLGIIHRDVSPQNVLLSYDGDLKVIDFGIAKAANRMVRTQTGILKGKFAYMAPEQAQGDPTDHRADIFAIGVILYELLTGERAFRAESDFALLEKVRRVDIVAPRKLNPAVPKELERIVNKAMAKDAADRYAWASAFSDDLERFMDTQQVRFDQEQLALFVRRVFRSEWEEELRRLKAYQAFRPADPDEGEGAAAAVLEKGGGTHERRTVGPVESGESDEGTRVVDSASDASGETVLHDERQPSPSAHAASLASAAAPADSDASDFDENFTVPVDTAAARSRLPSSVLLSSANVTELGPSSTGLSTQRRRIAGQDTRVHVPSHPSPLPPPRSEAPARHDATVVDPFPTLSSDEEPTRGREPDEGTRPDAARDSLIEYVQQGAARSERERPAPGPSGLAPLASSVMPRPPRTPSTDAKSLASALSNDEEDPDDAGALPEVPGHVDAGPLPTGDHIGSAGPIHRANPSAAAPSPRFPWHLIGGRPRLAHVVGLFSFVVFGIVLGVGGARCGLSPAPNLFVVAGPGAVDVRKGEEMLCERTPCAVHAEPGSVELTFFRGDEPVAFRTAQVPRDGHVVVEVSAVPKRELRVETTPAGAKVSLNGEAIAGETPLTLPGLHVGRRANLRIEKEGFVAVEAEKWVPDGEGGAWLFALQPTRTTWAVEANPPDAVIYAADMKGKAGAVSIGVEAGQSVPVRVERPGCETAQRVLAATEQATAELPIALTCAPFEGRVSVGSARRATIEVDGVPILKQTPLRDFPMPVGPHIVTLRRKGRAEPFAVVVKPGETFLLNTRFR